MQGGINWILLILLVRYALPIDGELNRCVNTKDGTLLSAPLY
jgi:hypothetical protein